MGSIAYHDEAASLPYWQLNVPPNQQTAECPEFLRRLSDKDRGILSTRDEDYRTPTWAQVQARVAQNQLQDFQRLPSKLRRYLAYTWQLREQHGSAANFVLRERLCWDTDEVAQRKLQPDARSLARSDDVKILWNDWPYGIDDRIVHLVVWSKIPFAEDAETGDLTDEARAGIQRFVDATFAEIPKDNIIWFKNWASLKTIHQIEHFHVMLYDAPQEFVDRVTNHDVPLFKKVAAEDVLK